MNFDELNALVLPFDEVDALIDHVRNSTDLNAEELEDSVLDLLIMDFVYGTESASVMLGEEIEPDMEAMRESIEKKFDGKGFRDRIREYSESGDKEAIVRVIDTDSTRVFNEGILSAAKGRATTKTWVTMKDDRVRDTHRYLEGQTIPVDARFYTYDGDSALSPGGFGLVQNNANCRCVLQVK
jgi:hypothetical protein